jgi:hypothetical protein
MVTFKHSGNAGDIIYSLPAILSVKDPHRVLYIALDQPASYSGREHPLGSVMCNKKVFEMLLPLLMATGIFKHIAVHQGEPIDYDLDRFRHANIDLGRGSITHWYSAVYPELRPDTSKPTIDLSKVSFISHQKPYIAVNRTFRYRNADVRYKCLNDYEGDVIFLGLLDEYDDLKLRVPKAIYHTVTDFLEAAMIIEHSSGFIGNQSMMFAIAEMTQHPRILEVFKHAPNVIPNGGEWYTAINEELLKKSLSLLK